MVRTLATLLMVALLSGCLGGGGDDGGDAASSSTSTTSAAASSTSRTSTSGAPAAPGTIEVELTREQPNGAVPLGVNFTLEATFRSASGSTATPSGAAWEVSVTSGNGTNASMARSGTSLPAAFALDFTEPGNHTVLATVQAPGYATANATVLVVASAAGAAVPIFFDGAEGDASQFTVSSNIWIYEVFSDTEQELDAEHPSGAWEASDAAAHAGAKSWFSHYPDNYRTRLQTLAIQVPAGGATLSYWVKGGAEANGADGLHVLVNDAEVALHNAVPDWTQFTVPLAAGETTVLFRFDSDMGCSDQSPGPAGDPSGSVCGAGFDQGGIHLDDILVA